jgi:hypothetical protein
VLSRVLMSLQLILHPVLYVLYTQPSYPQASHQPQTQPSCILLLVLPALRGHHFSLQAELDGLSDGLFSRISHVLDCLSSYIHETSQCEADAFVRTEGISSVKLLPYPKGRDELDTPWSVAFRVVK